MKKFAFICLALAFMSTGIGCCHSLCGGGGYGYQPYAPACPGGNCGIGYQGYAPSAAVPVQGYSSTTSVAPAPVAAAPVYYQPYTTAAMNYLPTY
jgi:hypothetical protein